MAELMINDLLRRHACEFGRQVTLGVSVYEHRVRADFVVHNLREFPDGLVIESKWQDGDGTADEKFPYVVANIRAGAYGGRPVLVVVHGGGCREGAWRWFCRQVDGRELVAVLSFEELVSWIQRRVTVIVRSPTFDWTTRSSRG